MHFKQSGVATSRRLSLQSAIIRRQSCAAAPDPAKESSD